ncbi:MAG: hypothetical protein MZV65_29690 [Chromatiales bacterium]|nr:hypothetical protein [Chromatiales bacterium]
MEMRPAESASITELTAQAAEAKRRAVLRCKGASACDKAMASAQDFVVLNSNMRIHVATDTLIETYKPIEIGQLGMKVLKVPVSGDEAELQLTELPGGRLAQVVPGHARRAASAWCSCSRRFDDRRSPDKRFASRTSATSPTHLTEMSRFW